MQHNLLYYPESRLREKTNVVRVFNDDLKHLAEDMRRIMKENSGMGLAANQVGDSRRLIIIEYPGDTEAQDPEIPFTVLANPKITKSSKDVSSFQEGCLSLPAIEVMIERANEVTVIAQSITGEPIRIRAKGMLARILQHEIDHLSGKLIIDYSKNEQKDDNALRTMVWGSTQFTTEFLNTIMPNPQLKIVTLVTEAPKPSGRGQEVKSTIVKTYADSLNIPCLEPHTLDDARFLSFLQTQAPDLIIVASYGKLVPLSILSLPKLGCINIHPSLLPKYRGATPIQSAILNGDKKTGVTVIKMSPQFDTGTMLAQSEYELDQTETFGDLESLLAQLGGEIVTEILPTYAAGHIHGVEQNNDLAAGTRKITPEDRWLNMDDEPKINERKIRAFYPTPKAYVKLNGQQVLIHSSRIEDGRLIFEVVQPSGKKPMEWQAFLHGYRQPLNFESLPEHIPSHKM
jgi:methionyl-tRNA formyltransferase